MSIPKITRSEAKVLGRKRYFTGEPCLRGHVAERFVSTKGCADCNSERNSSQELVAYRKAFYAERYASNKTEILERGKSYNKTASGHASTLVRSARRRANKQAAVGSYTASDAATIRGLQKDRCGYCRVNLKGRGSLDHIVALANGGSNWPSNLQWLCRSCNSRKHTKDPIDFARQFGRLL